MIDWTQLSEEQRAAFRRVTMPDFPEWERKIRATGGCANPVRIRGGRTVRDAKTGEVLDHVHTDDMPLGYLLVPCNNRRAEVCPSCAERYRYDAYQLVRAGLAGGKGVPDTVALHPMLFVTLTPPSFGAVHARHKDAGGDGLPKRCHPRRDAPTCPHGVILSCYERHDEGSNIVGQAFCMDCYDYAAAVLFNAHAGVLWRRLTIYLSREVARAAGLSRAAMAKVARVSFVKVAEYQARGVIHFHAVLRIDGPDGPGDLPPAWASAVLLDDCLRRAVAGVWIDVASHIGDGVARLRFGGQLDTQLIVDDDQADEDALSVTRVSRYVAKYATKSSETAGSVPRRIKKLWHVDYLSLPPHTERMVRTCFDLADRDEYADLHLDRWAHMLGYRGHCTTKSRRYSTTFAKLHGARRENRQAERHARLGLPSLDGRDLTIESDWRFVQSGLSFGEHSFVGSPTRR